MPFGLVLVLAILMFAILLPFGCCLLDPPGVLIGIASVWMLLKDFLLQFSHGIKVGTVWIPCRAVDTGMHMVQTWILHLTNQVSDLGLLVCN